jgi:transcriptional regulator
MGEGEHGTPPACDEWGVERGFSRPSRVDVKPDRLRRDLLFPLALRQEPVYCLLSKQKGREMERETLELPQGTLDLLILKTLALGPQHGWAISVRVRQISREVLKIQQGSLYPALHRLQRRGWIKARWGTSDNNRRAKYYELTRSGAKQLEAERTDWLKLTAAVSRVLGTT